MPEPKSNRTLLYSILSAVLGLSAGAGGSIGLAAPRQGGIDLATMQAADFAVRADCQAKIEAMTFSINEKLEKIRDDVFLIRQDVAIMKGPTRLH